MFDIGLAELVLLGLIVLIVVGPAQIPELMRTIGRYTGQMRRLAGDFRRQLHMMDEDIESVPPPRRKPSAKPISVNKAQEETPDLFDQTSKKVEDGE